MIRPVAIFVLLCFTILVGFQNCGSSVRLSKTATSTRTIIPPKSIGQFCGPDSVEVYVPQNLIMVVDMSASNTSLYVEQTPDFSYLGGVPHWYYHLGPAAYADCVAAQGPANCIPPTDSDAAGQGRRFTALINYLQSCPQNAEPTNRYGVIGFSTGILRAPGFGSRSCEDPLQSRQYAENEINAFSALQRTEVGAGTVIAPAYPFKMDKTSYRTALQCMDDRIRNDLNPESIQRSYKVLFLTDGRPSDKAERVYRFPGGWVDIPLWEEYGKKLDQMKNFLIGQGFNFVFQPIYYGLADEKADALDNLNRMALTVSAGVTTIELDPTSADFTASLSESFCKSPAEKLTVGYSSWGGVQVIPLTTIQRDQDLYADRDMDGIVDDEEAANSFSPTLSHSRSLLDSLCLRYRVACETFETAYATNPTICDRNLAYGVGFNQCDQKFMDDEIIRVQDSFGRTPFTGIDDDGDGILTYVELLKGTDPLDPDLDHDPDNDGILTRAEILQGTDPFSTTSAATTADFRHSLSFTPASSCGSGVGYQMAIEAMPVIDIEDLQETRVTSHATNENVFALVYFAKPVAYSTRIVKVFIRYLKVMNDANQTVTIGPQIAAGEVVLP